MGRRYMKEESLYKIGYSDEVSGPTFALERLRLQAGESAFCDLIGPLLKELPELEGIHRVCLVRRLGLSNAIQVVESRNFHPASPNIIPEGYFCFVRPQSSLFSIPQAQVRLYDEAVSIMHSFLRTEGAPQRSIRLIFQMGFRSGACLPIYLGRHARAFLFFNSLERGLFSQAPSKNLALYRLLAGRGAQRLERELSINLELDLLSAEYGSIPIEGRFFSGEEFSKYLMEMSRRLFGAPWRTKIQIEFKGTFLYSPFLTAYNFGFLWQQLAAEGLNSGPRTLQLRSAADPYTCEALMEGIDGSSSLWQVVERRLMAVGMSMERQSGSALIRFPADFASAGESNQLYSV
jgi:hypothetical protein